jgi:hypothetical protein
MKLWYQSMSRQTELGGYPAVLRSILDKVKDTRRGSKKRAHAPPRSEQIEAFPGHHATVKAP